MQWHKQNCHTYCHINWAADACFRRLGNDISGNVHWSVWLATSLQPQYSIPGLPMSSSSESSTSPYEWKKQWLCIEIHSWKACSHWRLNPGPRARTTNALTRVATNRWSSNLIYRCRYWMLRSHTDSSLRSLLYLILCRKYVPLGGAGSRRQNTSPSSELNQSNVEKPVYWFALFEQSSKVFVAFFVLQWNFARSANKD